MNVIIFGSGSGSLTNAICESVNNGVLNMNIKCLITNNKDSNIGTIGMANNIKFYVSEWNKEDISREEYDLSLLQLVNNYNDIDLIIFAGWTHIVTEKFINNVPEIINIHPSLPNGFVGLDCIKKAKYHIQEVWYIK